MHETFLRTHGLTKKYGDFLALDHVSLSLGRGDVYGLVGRNGAGKTTFFKCVMGLANISAGEIEIAGRTSDLDSARKLIGVMISPSFYPFLDPWQNLESLCILKQIPHKRAEITRLLKLVGLDGIKRPFKTFSMGMKQRLGLAGALLGSPPLIVLDEPINGLDPQGIAEIREIIKQENIQNGTTFIISSHILNELDLVTSRFGFIEKGRLLQEISHADLHAQAGQKALVLEVDDVARTLAILQAKLGIVDAQTEGNRLTLSPPPSDSRTINRLLLTEGVEVYRLTPVATSLEDYFMHLVGA